MSDTYELKDRPLSELSAIDSARELKGSDLILISKKDGDHDNFLSRNMTIGAFETFTMSSYVNPALDRVSTDLCVQMTECSTFLSNFIDTSVVHTKPANYSLECIGTGYVKSVSQKDGILSAVSGDMEGALNISQYCRKADLNGSAYKDKHYMAGFTQTSGKVAATLCAFENVLSVHPLKKDLNTTINIPSNVAITSVKQTEGKVSITTVDNTFSLRAPDGNIIKSIASDGYGKLTATYKEMAKCDVTCSETEYIKRIKLSEDEVIIQKAPHVDYWPMKACLEAIYPVGAIYLATTNYCPLQGISGMSWRWVQVSQDRVLQGSNGENAGTTIEAGLPHITGYFSIRHAGRLPGTDGAFYIQSIASAPAVHFGECGNRDCHGVSFSASRSNAIYGNSTTVQPPAYVVTVWKRVS